MKAKKISQPRVMMQMRVPLELHAWLKRYAADNRTTLSGVLLRYAEWLRGQDQKSLDEQQI